MAANLIINENSARLSNTNSGISTNTKYKLFSKQFWNDWIVKILITMISAKIWGLIVITWLATYLLINKYITGAEWSTTICTIYSVIYGMRELFKISSLNDINNS